MGLTVWQEVQVQVFVVAEVSLLTSCLFFICLHLMQ